MNHFVPRTCTEIGEDGSPIGSERSSHDFTGLFGLLSGDDSPAESECPSRSLEHYRESDAYVLLGAPGAGKTESFKQEAECGGGRYRTARDFITLDDRPEWHDATLFIDGLDEMRAGATDGRTPLDAIRAKLDRLGRPRFRLSCREADWFGANDREHLKSVSRGEEVKVLRLDPLSEDSIRELLRRHPDIEDMDGFIALARERGIDGLLANPQSLLMLVQAVSGGSWPKTRTQTFELACRRLVHEHNVEHQVAQRSRAPSDSELLDAAGRLCVLQLLTGSAGYDLLGDGSGSECLGLQQVSGGDQATFRQVLGTRLFGAPGESCVAPTHRQIAEFLAGRYLSQRIGEGLPVGRVLVLMTGEDGGIVSEFRGLSAWIAAHGKTSRGEIVDRDPFGVVLYGDVRGFSCEEKWRILKYMNRETKKDPWFSSVTWIDSRLGDLATIDMRDVFLEILTASATDGAQQRLVFVVLQALTYGQETVIPFDPLMRIVRDDSRWPRVRCQALDVLLITYQKQQSMGIETLRALLMDVHAGSVSDPSDDLLGTLLRALYPSVLPTSEILQYLKTPCRSSLLEEFWTIHLPEKSTTTQLAELLDAITKRFDQLRPALSSLDGISSILLSRYLQTAKGVVPSEKLFDWLMLVSDLEASTLSGYVESWLASHPDVQKEMIAIGVMRYNQSPDFFHRMSNMKHLFFGVEHPSDFGHWCLNQAIAASNSKIREYFIGQVVDYVYTRSHDEELSYEIIKKHLIDNHDLLHLFIEKFNLHECNYKQSQIESSKIQKRMEARKLQHRQQWRDMVTPYRSALRENRCPPDVLHRLAEVYYKKSFGIEGDTPRERFHAIFDNDDDLVEAALDGLCGAANHSDVPDSEEIIRLNREKQYHLMNLPFLAGLEEIGGPPDERRLRQALAMYYTRSINIYMNQPPTWYESVLDNHVDIAVDVLIQSIQTEIRGGSEHIYGIRKLRDNDDVAKLASIPLLQAFPVRCLARQLSVCGALLGIALRFCEATELFALVDRKIAKRSMDPGQRVYWLTAGLFISESSDSAELYREQLREYIYQNERRIQKLMEFMEAAIVDHVGNWISRKYSEYLDVLTLEMMIRFMGSLYRPYKFDPHEFDSRSYLIHNLINRLAIIPSSDAAEIFESLLDDDDLNHWKIYLMDAAYRQNTVRRESCFHHPVVDQVLETLDGNRPANVADLAALTFDFLTELARTIRDGNTNDWRQYWNLDQNSHRKRLKPMHEDHCRDRLLSDLQARTGPLGIDATPEGRYADEKRSDIRVSYGGFNVPVEIKKSDHRNLWSAIRNQLTEKYTRGAGGYGIYLVFWFGKENCQPPESGPRPSSAAELEKRLLATLSPEEARMIGICVIDVSGTS